MEEGAFWAEFADGAKLTRAVREALKSFACCRDHVPLHGGWMIAAGVYRNMFPAMPWQNTWQPRALAALPDGDSAALIGTSRQLRQETLRTFACMCTALFCHEDTFVPLLERVELQQNRLSLFVQIPSQKLRVALAETIKDWQINSRNLLSVQHAPGMTHLWRHGTSSVILAFGLARLASEGGSAFLDEAARFNIVVTGTGIEVRFGG
jgi:hypothetical protein